MDPKGPIGLIRPMGRFQNMANRFIQLTDVTGRRHVINIDHISSLRDYGGIDKREHAPQTVIELISGSTLSVADPLEKLAQILGLEPDDKMAPD